MTTHLASDTRAAEVQLRNVSKRYGNVDGCQAAGPHDSRGSLVTLLGPSGCGKTTLLRMIAGLERVTEGEILIGGKDVTQLSAGERNVSMVFQSYALFPHMSVLENVAYGLISGGANKREGALQGRGHPRSCRPEGIWSAFAVRDVPGVSSSELLLARALVLKPDVLLFDEPLSNLDGPLATFDARGDSCASARSRSHGRVRHPRSIRGALRSPTSSS